MNVAYATVADRIKSTLIDSIIVIALMVLVSDVFNSYKESLPNVLRVIAFVLLFMYEPLCTAFGATIGNQKSQIRIRKISDETQKINFFQAIIRFLLKITLGWLSFLSIFFSNKSRTIHDIVTGTVVIKLDE